MTAAYHPQTNGLDERTNQTLKTALRKVINEHQTDWDEFLDGALFAQRTKPQSTTRYSPFFLLYGREAVYPSQLPKDFGDANYTPVTEHDDDEVQQYVENRASAAPELHTKVQENIGRAQTKQKQQYKQKAAQGRTYIELKAGDKVLVYDSKKAGTKSKGNLQQNYSGPYTISTMEGKTVTLINKNGLLLKKAVNIDKVKPFTTTDANSTTADTNSTTTSDTNSTTTSDTNSTTTKTDNHIMTRSSKTTQHSNLDQFLNQLSATGELSELINLTSRLQLPPSTTLLNIRQQLTTCPTHTFVAEISRSYEDEMDYVCQKLLPSVRHIQIGVSGKVSLTMVLGCICIKSWATSVPVMKLVETLKRRPDHLTTVIVGRQYPADDERIYVGGDCLSTTDLATLEPKEWLNDKVINAFLGLLREERNLTDEHIFIIPSYTAVLWESGNFNHWMFKKVRFSMYQYILMPFNVNGNHWCLMVVSMMDKRVTILDSMHGPDSQKYAEYWRNFVACRNNVAEETLNGPWESKPNTSNKQLDGSSCGIFVLMNAECLALGIPIEVMRQVHVAVYRNYAKERLVSSSSEVMRDCAMPGCKDNSTDVMHCGVCGRWFHRRCSDTPDDGECVICSALYR